MVLVVLVQVVVVLVLVVIVLVLLVLRMCDQPTTCYHELGPGEE